MFQVLRKHTNKLTAYKICPRGIENTTSPRPVVDSAKKSCAVCEWIKIRRKVGNLKYITCSDKTNTSIIDLSELCTKSENLIF